MTAFDNHKDTQKSLTLNGIINQIFSFFQSTKHKAVHVVVIVEPCRVQPYFTMFSPFHRKVLIKNSMIRSLTSRPAKITEGTKGNGKERKKERKKHPPSWDQYRLTPVCLFCLPLTGIGTVQGPGIYDRLTVEMCAAGGKKHQHSLFLVEHDSLSYHFQDCT